MSFFYLRAQKIVHYKGIESSLIPNKRGLKEQSTRLPGVLWRVVAFLPPISIQTIYLNVFWCKFVGKPSIHPSTVHWINIMEGWGVKNWTENRWKLMNPLQSPDLCITEAVRDQITEEKAANMQRSCPFKKPAELFPNTTLRKLLA